MSEKKIDIEKIINVNPPQKKNKKKRYARGRRYNRRARNLRRARRALNKIAGFKSSSLGNETLMSFNPISLRDITFGKASKIVNSYSKYLALSYIFGLIHPDSAVKNKISVKAPSPLPIPTTCFGFKETHVITTSASGRFAIVWSPEYLGSSDGIASLSNEGNFSVGIFANTYVNNSDTMTGDAADNHFNPHFFKRVTVPFSKYRLTSAMIKVKYTGNVLQQAGVMSSCATYVPFDRTILVKTPTAVLGNYANSSMANMAIFDVVKNGQWNQTMNVTADANGLRALYVPTDGLSSVFCNDACSATAKPIQVTHGTDIITYKLQSENTKLSYVFVGHGLQSSSPCITIECYYNYEIIVKPDMMPYFQNGNIVPIDKNLAEAGYREVSNVAAQDGLIRQYREDMRQASVGSKWKNFLTRSAQFINNKVIPAVQVGAKLASIIGPLF